MATERSVGLGFHLRRRIGLAGRTSLGFDRSLRPDLGRLRLRGLRRRTVRFAGHRHLCPPHRRLAGLAHRPRQLRARRLGQALHERRSVRGSGLVRHSGRTNLGLDRDRGGQCLALRYANRLAEAGIEPSVGHVGVSYDNALAETFNGLHKAEAIHQRGPWRSFEAVEFAALEWVGWFNNPWRRARHACSNLPATCRLPRQRRAAMPRSRNKPWPRTQTNWPPGNPERFKGRPAVAVCAARRVLRPMAARSGASHTSRSSKPPPAPAIAASRQTRRNGERWPNLKVPR